MVTTVYHENGWTSESGGVIARSFLKQDKDLLARVWDYIYQSCMPLGFDKPLGTPLPAADYERLLDRNYDRFCLNHWKRFLLEVDLRQDSLKIVAPRIMDDGSDMPYLSSSPPSRVLADNSQYFEQDLGRPYIDELYSHLEMSREEAWI
ncbi:hypothetical protein RYA05_04620 [Pseudomonas syringae pv. actinidiae]|nr:hypothetical protein [Pseudomonas syringae pv. actinidiae]